ncbi:MAG: SRPBCC family protein [Actinobacteria bacterium]|nr:SRPBCC family protein [Actinomycetota bacterium]
MGDERRDTDDGRDRTALTRSLGWFSLALGTAQVLAPHRVARLIGVEPTPRTETLMRAVGTQELLLGAGVLRRPPRGWLWSRVAGDISHLAMLAAAIGSDDGQRERTAKATAAVAAIGVVDLVASLRAGGDAGRAVRSVSSLTVNRAPDEVYRRWRRLEDLPGFSSHVTSVEVRDRRRSHWVATAPGGTTVEWDAEIVADVPGRRIAWRSLPGADVANEGTIRFAPAPGDRGTEVTLELRYDVPGGGAGRAIARMLGEHPEQAAEDDLRRFKQMVETGQVVRSDGSPDGTRSRRQMSQQPALPRA